MLAIAKQCGRQELYRRTRLRKPPSRYLWCDLSRGQAQLIALYQREVKYHGEPARTMNRWTLRRHLTAWEDLGCVRVIHRPVRDRRTGLVRSLPNRYELLPVGKLFIKKRFKGARVPLVTTDG